MRWVVSLGKIAVEEKIAVAVEYEPIIKHHHYHDNSLNMIFIRTWTHSAMDRARNNGIRQGVGMERAVASPYASKPPSVWVESSVGTTDLPAPPPEEAEHLMCKSHGLTRIEPMSGKSKPPRCQDTNASLLYCSFSC